MDKLSLEEKLEHFGDGEWIKENGVQLAKEYGVSHHNIYCILKRKNWTHI